MATGFKHLACGIVLTFSSLAAVALPYIPKHPSQVLETLPENSRIASQEFKYLRAQLKKHPTSSSTAAKLAQLYIELSRIEGDPRFLGYAQSALAPWWDVSDPPIDVLVLRATILQSTHHFDEALVDIDRVLNRDPQNGQAWITRATILQVQGKYQEAYKSCEQLSGLAANLVTLTCVTNIQSLNGHAAESYQKLKAGYVDSGETNPSLQVWILTLLAEMATRLGDHAAAEQHFKKALKIEDSDSYLLGSYADFLLDQQRFNEVIQLLDKKTPVDALLLRYAEALNFSHSTKAPLQINSLKQRFEAATLRGDTVHQREQSRFELRLMHNPSRALKIAKHNWEVQKEPADIRVYLEAALAANNDKAVESIKRWLKSSKLEDASLNQLISKYNNK